MNLPLPLHKYDDAGRVKPPWLLYAGLLFMARAVVVFIASVSFRQDSSRLLSLFYPDKYHFYMAMSVAVPALFLVLLIGFREKIWQAEGGGWYRLLPLLLGALIVTDFIVQIYIINAKAFLFEYSTAASLLVMAFFTIYLCKSRHMRYLFKDWRLNQ